MLSRLATHSSPSRSTSSSPRGGGSSGCGRAPDTPRTSETDQRVERNEEPSSPKTAEPNTSSFTTTSVDESGSSGDSECRSYEEDSPYSPKSAEPTSDDVSHSSHDDSTAEEASSPISAVGKFVQSTLYKGVEGLIKEFDDRLRDEERTEYRLDSGKFLISSYTSWSQVWKANAAFVLFIGVHAPRWFAVDEGQSKREYERVCMGFDEYLKTQAINKEHNDIGSMLDQWSKRDHYDIRCMLLKTTGPIDFRKFTVAKVGSTVENRTLGVIHWKAWQGEVPPTDRLLPIIINQLSLSNRPVIIIGDSPHDKRMYTILLAQKAMVLLRGGCSLEGGLTALMEQKTTQIQYLFVHRVLLEHFKTEANAEKLRRFEADWRCYLDANLARFATRSFVELMLHKGVQGLLKELKGWSEERTENRLDSGKFLISSCASWSQVWEANAAFVLYIGVRAPHWFSMNEGQSERENESSCKFFEKFFKSQAIEEEHKTIGSMLMRLFAKDDGQSKKEHGYSIHCTLLHSSGQMDFRKFTVVRKVGSTVEKRTLGVIHWKEWVADVPTTDRLLPILIDQLSLSTRPVILTSDNSSDKRLLVFLLAEKAMTLLRGGCSLYRELKSLMGRIGRRKADEIITGQQYLFVHRELLEHFKTEANDEQLCQFRADYRYLDAKRVRIYNFTPLANEYCGRTKRRDLSFLPFARSENHLFACECTMLNRLIYVKSPKMEGGLALIFLYGDVEIRDGQYVVVCGDEKSECRGSDCIPLSKIVETMDEWDDCHVLIVLMNVKPAKDGGTAEKSLATGRIALLMAESNGPVEYSEQEDEDDETDSSGWEECHEIMAREDILYALSQFADPREAPASLNGQRLDNRDQVTLVAEVHKEWMTKGFGSLTHVCSQEEEKKTRKEPMREMKRSEFRRLLESTRSTDDDERCDAEIRMRRIPAGKKGNLLLHLIKSEKDGEMRSLAVTRLYSLIGCNVMYWGDKNLNRIAKQIIEAARAETSPTLCEPIGRVLSRISLYLIDDALLLEFIRQSASSSSLIVKSIAIDLAARGEFLLTWGSEVRGFLKKMVLADETRPQALKRVAQIAITNHRRDWNNPYDDYEGGEAVVDHLRGIIPTIAKLSKKDDSLRDGSPLWTLVQIGCGAPNVQCARHLNTFLKAALREEDENMLRDLVETISNQLQDSDEDEWKSWNDLTPLVDRCIARGIITKSLLTMISPDSYDGKHDYNKESLCTMMTAIEQALSQPELQRVASTAFGRVMDKAKPDQCPLEAVDRIVRKIIELAEGRKRGMRSLNQLACDAPWTVHRHFSAAITAAIRFEQGGGVKGYLSGIIRLVAVEMEDVEGLSSCFTHSHPSVRTAAECACLSPTMVNSSKMSYFIPRLIELAANENVEAVSCLRSLVRYYSGTPLFKDHRPAVKRILGESPKCSSSSESSPSSSVETTVDSTTSSSNECSPSSFVDEAAETQTSSTNSAIFDNQFGPEEEGLPSSSAEKSVINDLSGLETGQCGTEGDKRVRSFLSDDTAPKDEERASTSSEVE